MRNMTPRTYIRIVLVAHLSFFRLQQRQPRTDGNHMCSRDGDVAPDVRHGVAAVGLDSGLARPADAGRVPRAGRRRLLARSGSSVTCDSEFGLWSSHMHNCYRAKSEGLLSSKNKS